MFKLPLDRCQAGTRKAIFDVNDMSESTWTESFAKENKVFAADVTKILALNVYESYNAKAYRLDTLTFLLNHRLRTPTL